jgi:hypothetical protein
MVVGGIAFLAAITMLLGVSSSEDGKQVVNSDMTFIALPFAVIGYFLISYGQAHFRKWRKKPTPLQALLSVLKSGNKKNVLFNYVPNAPAEHILLTPGGVFPIVAKHVEGKVIGEGSSWKHSPAQGFNGMLTPLAFIRMGSPIEEVLLAEENTQKIVSGVLGEDEAKSVVVKGVVVFTEPETLVKISDPPVPALTPDDLRGFIVQQGESRLTPGQMEKLTIAFAGGLEVKDDDRPRSKPQPLRTAKSVHKAATKRQTN